MSTRQSSFLISLGIVLILFLSTFAQKEDVNIQCFCKFKCYQDTSETGNFIWNGDYFIGTINIFSNENSNKLEATWEFVKICSFNDYKTVSFFPSIAHTWECGSGFSQIKNVKLNGDQILFDLFLDAACEYCSITHFIGYKNKRNSFSGNGMQKSFVDNKMYKHEFRAISEIQLPSTKIR